VTVTVGPGVPGWVRVTVRGGRVIVSVIVTVEAGMILVTVEPDTVTVTVEAGRMEVNVVVTVSAGRVVTEIIVSVTTKVSVTVVGVVWTTV